ncbi:hypothetical protein [Streptococcus dentiloxodontae]
MSKKVYIFLEIVKIFLISCFVSLVYHAALGAHAGKVGLPLIGTAFLIMLATVITASIVIDILISFFTPREKHVAGEWEHFVNQNILRNFAYGLSIFFVILMAAFALNVSHEPILLLLRIGFFILIAVHGITKAYYYAG